MLRALFVWIALCGSADAATFDLEVRGPAWQVEALRATLVVDLASDQLQYAPPGDLHIAITVGASSLTYLLTRDGAAPVRGAVALGAIDRQKLAGVLKDELHRLVPHSGVRDAKELPPPTASIAAFAGLAVLAALLLLPLVWSRRVYGRVVFALAGLVAAGAVIATGGLADSAMFLVGGLAWGAVLAVIVPIAWPPFAGLQRVEHHELGAALRAWTALALQRTLWVATWLALLGAVLWLVSPAPLVATFGVIAPLVILTLRTVWRAFAAALAARLDARFIDENADAWHEQVRGYFVGYLRRANLDVDDELLARVKFLPGNEPERVAIYGGGLTHSRIVIGRAMLENALAPYGRPHDYAMPRVSTLHWTHWNSGLVMPTADDEVLASRADRDPKTSAHESEAGEHERVALGELPTLIGVIEPAALDPRTAYRPEEDPLWLDWDPGEEHDGTDAGDKDFLFGVLVLALGVVQRHEDRGATFALASPHLARLARITAPLRSRTVARLAELQAVLGGARHHLAQFFAWQLWYREELLTARAYVPQLEERSRAIVAALDTDADDNNSARERLRRLARFIDPRAVVKRTQRQRVALAFALIAAFAVVAALVVQAALYHSTYEERHARDGKRS
ncbi:MAG TPA: hypothetical protein VIV11_20560 [Kofleriaceae bacterium]